MHKICNYCVKRMREIKQCQDDDKKDEVLKYFYLEQERGDEH